VDNPLTKGCPSGVLSSRAPRKRGKGSATASFVHSDGPAAGGWPLKMAFHRMPGVSGQKMGCTIGLEGKRLGESESVCS